MLGRYAVLLLGATMIAAVFTGPVNAQESSSPAPTSAPPPESTTAAPPPSETYTPPPPSSSSPPSESYSSPPPPPPSGTYSPPPPPPQCPQGSWWDQGKQQCVSSGGYSQPPPPPSGSYQGGYNQPPPCPPPPEPCGPPPSGSYQQPPPCQPGQPCGPPPDGQYQGGYQGGYQGDYNRPPPCEPGQPCGPPPGGQYGYQGDPNQGGYYGNGSQPQGQYQPYRDECSEKFSLIHDEFRAFVQEKELAARSFHEEFNRARMEFSRERHSADEWRAFTESWNAKGGGNFDTIKSEIEARFKDRLGGEECWNRFGMQHFGGGGPMMGGGPGMGGPGMGGPPMDGGFIPNFGGMGPPGMDGQHMMPTMRPPMPNEDRRFKMSDEAEKIRIECEHKVWELIGPPPHEVEAFEEWKATHPEAGTGPPHMTPEIDKQIRDIMRECEKKIRATFQDEFKYEHSDEDVEDFKEKFGSLDMFMDEESGLIIVQGKHLALKGQPEAQIMQDLTCQGAKFVDQLFVNGLLADFTPEETGEGTALRITDSNGERVLQLHDNPRCVVNLAASGEIPSITIDLADHLEVETNDAGDLHFSDGDVDGALLLHGADVELQEGNVAVITGKATFLVHNKGAASDNLGGSLYEDAIENKQVGAEIKIAAGDGDDDIAVDETSLGDLETEVEGEKDKITVTIDSEAGTGKTVVLEIDTAVFSSDELEVVVEGVDAEGNATNLNAVESSDLSDILDPLDDGAETVEYWIIQDKNGFHVLVSFPHFSEKRVTIQSAQGEPEKKDSLIPGFEAAVLVAALGLSLIVVGLRRRDE